MNKAERTTVARVIVDADEAGFTSLALERLRNVLARHDDVQTILTERRTTTSKRAKGNPIPQASRQAVLERSRGFCEVATPACRGMAGYPQMHQAHHVHHIAGRTDHNPGNLLHVCQPAHAWIHANPSQSYVNGWLRKRLGVDG